MSSTVLERARQTHEEVEALTRLAATALAARDGGNGARLGERAPRGALEAAQLARQLADAARERCGDLADMYADADGSIAECATDMRGGVHGSALSSFYAQLRDIRELHRSGSESTSNNIGIASDKNDTLHDELLRTLPGRIDWTPEEAGGTCLDLHASHGAFANVLGRARRVDYVAYVRSALLDFDALPSQVRRSRAYADYLRELQHYLINFARRAYPLDDLDELVDTEKERARATRREREARDAETHRGECAHLRHRFGDDTAKLLEAMPLAEVTRQLRGLGLKAGGRPLERAQRLLQHARAVCAGSDSGDQRRERSNAAAEERADLEAVVQYLGGEVLGEERVATAHNAEKKLALSFEELLAERRSQEALQLVPGAANGMDGAAAGAEDGDEEPVYNPKDVPLGWDGKPIPYWLYKLHGLNHEFKCEICGDTVYRGPRAFERHFAAAQHVHGLRCLGIRYSKEYLMITRIADAVALNARLSKQRRVGAGSDDCIEYEDSNGNVLARKTYEDLSRQGLL